MVDPAIWPVWLSDVRELRPLWRVFATSPLTAAAMTAFPAVALLAAVLLMRVERHRRDFAFWAATATFAAAVAVTVVAVRGYSYAIWFGMPLVAALILRLFALLSLRALPARIATALALTPLVLSSGAIGIASAAGLHDTEDFSRPESRACFQTRNYQRLATLSPGLVVADISYGPFLLALTPHSVLSAPYHWQSAGIVAAHRSLAALPAEARDLLKRWRVDYVVTCGPRPPVGLDAVQRKTSLWGRLQAGTVPDWLEPVEAGPAFSVYRVRERS
jgi:hypothetical protein